MAPADLEADVVALGDVEHVLRRGDVPVPGERSRARSRARPWRRRRRQVWPCSCPPPRRTCWRRARPRRRRQRPRRSGRPTPSRAGGRRRRTRRRSPRGSWGGTGSTGGPGIPGVPWAFARSPGSWSTEAVADVSGARAETTVAPSASQTRTSASLVRPAELIRGRSQRRFSPNAERWCRRVRPPIAAAASMRPPAPPADMPGAGRK